MNAYMSMPKNISWLRIFAESVAIIASILIAFGINTAWEYRGAVEEEREILIGLESEFVDLLSRLQNLTEYNRRGVQLIEQFLSDERASMDLQTIEEMLGNLIAVNVLDQGGALDSLMASGRLERIRDHDIRFRLSKFPDYMEDIHTNDLSFREFALHEIAPFLVARGIPSRLCPETAPFFCEASGPMPDSYVDLTNDAQFRALIVLRRSTMLMSAVDHEDAGVQAKALIELIRARISSLEG